MTSLVKKFGNSTGVILPAALIKQLGINVGSPAHILQEDDKLVITVQGQLKKRPTLGDLLARCDAHSPAPVLGGWDDLESTMVGEELI